MNLALLEKFKAYWSCVCEMRPKNMETVYLLKSPVNASRLLHSIQEANEGKLIERELAEPVSDK